MRQRRGQRRSYRRIKWLAAILMIIVIVIAGIIADQQIKNDSVATEEDFYTDDKIMHVMILGVDRRADDVGRSDTIMVTAIDMDKEKAALLSVPRDTRVKIDGETGYEKINHAYAYGGHKLTQNAIEKLLGVSIDHYILIDTKAFARIIDAIGGVDIDVEKRMYYEDPWDDDGGLVIDLYPGEQHLDGKKAIQYVRYRDGEGDIGRIGRQQKFMKAVLAKVISPDMITRLPKLAEEVSSAVETDMSLADLLEFANIMKNVHNNGLEAQMVPGQPAYIDDVSYWIPDITDLRQLLASELDLPYTDEMAAKAQEAEDNYKKSLPKGLKLLAIAKDNDTKNEDNSNDKESQSEKLQPEQISVMVINDSGINGAGAQVAAILQRKGFIISSVETGKTSSREQTTITTAAKNVDLFYNLPFTNIIMEGGSNNQAVIHIGLDYKK